MPEITKELREQLRSEWVEALESGKYEQARGYLHPVDDGYCCLGVACEVVRRHFGEIKVEDDGYNVTYNEHDSDLPRFVQNAIGLRCSTGTFESEPGTTTSLTTLNDERAMSFPEIAAVIRSRPPGLFVD